MSAKATADQKSSFNFILVVHPPREIEVPEEHIAQCLENLERRLTDGSSAGPGRPI